MLYRAIAKDLGASIDGLTFAPDAAGGNVFVGHMPNAPDAAVAIMPTGGDQQATRAATDLPTFQVLVRGDRFDVDGSYAVARAIYSRLACLDHVTLDDDGDDEVRVVGITPLQSDPTPIGRDENDRPEWSQNFSSRIHSPTLNRT